MRSYTPHAARRFCRLPAVCLVIVLLWPATHAVAQSNPPAQPAVSQAAPAQTAAGAAAGAATPAGQATPPPKPPSVEDWIKPIGTFIAVVGSVTAAVMFRIKQIKLEAELKDANARIVQLKQDYENLGKADREKILNKSHLKVKVDFESLEAKLAEIVTAIGADCFGVFVPDPDPANHTDGKFRYLAFLWGSGPQCGQWWNRRISTDGDSKAARVFSHPGTEPPVKLKKEGERELIALPYPTENDCKAVIEFIHHENASFTDKHVEEARDRIALMALASKQNEGILRALTDMEVHKTVLEKRPYVEVDAVILVADISAFSETLLEMSEESMVPFLRNYFAQMGEIVIAAGGALEASLGDGLLVSFNVHGSPTDNYVSRAIDAAMKMQQSFERIRHDFLKTAGLVEGNKLFHRVSLSWGQLIQANFSDRRGSRESILGRVVNEATKLCDHAPRDADCIVYSQDFKKEAAATIGSDPTWPEEVLPRDTLSRIGITAGREAYVRKRRPKTV